MLAALLVLFSSMLNPMVSMVIAVAALIALGTYHFITIISLKNPVVAAITTFQHS
jgi:hypothetical protein